MRPILLLLFLLPAVSFAQTDAYEQAWNALNKNQHEAAERLLEKAMTVKSTAGDAYITNLYLKSYRGKDKEIRNFADSFYRQQVNPYPYVYALWFSKPVLGEYGKKTKPWQLNMIDQLIADQKSPGSLVAAANYQKALHYIFSAEHEKAVGYANAVGGLQNWQFTGPFENLSGSGFYKDNGPLQHPEPQAVFKSATNAAIQWFTPAAEVKEGWILVQHHFEASTAVVYAQTFVNSPTDQNVICNAGFSGALKLWINDELLISESKEKTTELDAYSVNYRLRKGVNRVLVQLSFTDLSVPNFCIRITDQNYRPIPGIAGSTTYSSYQKENLEQGKPEKLTHFAEQYFREKIKQEPTNLINYLLGTDALLRNSNFIEARTLLTKALTIAPDNALLRRKLVEVLVQENNRLLLLDELGKLRQNDPDCLLVLELDIKEFYKNEKYDDCEAAVEKRIKLFGEDEVTKAYEIMLALADQNYDAVVKLGEEFYEQYPDNSNFVEWMYTVKKDVYEDPKAGLDILEKYLKTSFNYTTTNKYADALIENGEQTKGLAVRDEVIRHFPYDKDMPFLMANYYFGKKQYDKAEEYLAKSIALSPYSEKYWELSGDIQREKNNKTKALQAYDQSLRFNPNQYSIIAKIRKLDKKPDISKLFDEVDVWKFIEKDDQAAAKNQDYGYYYILDRKDVVMYPGGANEEFVTLLIRITNESGIEHYKESTIGYSNWQSLLIENAEILKPNKSKIAGEKNGNEVVFTNLEVGDILYFRYRLQSFATGRFTGEYWDKHHFTDQVYSSSVSYNLLVPSSQKISYILTESSLKPSIKSVEDFTLYSWKMDKGEVLKYEPLMPVMADVASVLHISTIGSWNEISRWYSDAVYNRSEESIEVSSVYNDLIPAGDTEKTEFAKARKIYDYIANNIKYSSVSFRQGAFVPQQAATTLTTRLGDCKDLSNLFVTFARMAGIKSQMVLVDTRNYGQRDILLPSVEFNHCIVKAVLDGKEYYIEMTDNYLPFASLPANLNGAIALEIPEHTSDMSAKLIFLNVKNKTKDVVRRIIEIKPVDGDLDVSVKAVKFGALSSGMRNDYRNLNNDKQKQQLEKSIAGNYKNHIEMKSVEFTDLDKLDDSVSYDMHYTVKNEINEIAGMQTFKVIYSDVIATLDNFSAAEREFPVEYWNYETVDLYDNEVNIIIPAGKQFVEIPKSENYRFKDMEYSLIYKQPRPGHLQILRTFSNNRPQQISVEEYPAFKSFFEKIIKAEQKFIAFK